VTHVTRTVVVLGSTGPIGTQALSVISDHRDRFRVAALGSDGASMAQFAWQLVEYGAEVAAIADWSAAEDLHAAVHQEAARRGLAHYRPPQILAGPTALAEAAALPCDVALNATVGPAGLALTLAALDAGRTVALADNESLIIGGRLITDRAAPGQLVPVDPGHAALAQSLYSSRPADVRRLVLTAADSPFRGRRRTQAAVTPRAALAGPARPLGPVGSVNQATLVDKGLQLIEAHLLFGVPFDEIEVVIHPQSVVHSMVEFVDGSTVAQLSPLELGRSLLWALAWPERVATPGRGPDWARAAAMTFTPLDEEQYPAVALAGEAGRDGGSAPAVYHAANQECVAAFLAGRIKFPQIVDIIARVLADHPGSGPAPSLDEIQAAQQWARARTREYVSTKPRRLRAALRSHAVTAAPARYARRVLLATPREHRADSGWSAPNSADSARADRYRPANGPAATQASQGSASAQGAPTTPASACPSGRPDTADLFLTGRGRDGARSDPDRFESDCFEMDGISLGFGTDAAGVDRAVIDWAAAERERAAAERAEFDRVVQDVAFAADLMIVVGSATATDSVRLVEVALDAGVAAAYLVDDAADLDPRWLDGVGTVGVTSGASVPAERVTRVLARLARSGYGRPVPAEAELTGPAYPAAAGGRTADPRTTGARTAGPGTPGSWTAVTPGTTLDGLVLTLPDEPRVGR
jgi:1-deoxy-D-xylulose-5-phosphate reductoisomerase